MEVGAAVLRAAVTEELAEGHCEVGPKELMNMSKVRTDIQSSFHKIQKLCFKTLTKLLSDFGFKKQPLNVTLLLHKV